MIHKLYIDPLTPLMPFTLVLLLVLSTRVSAKLQQLIADMAKRTGVSISAIVRDAIYTYLQRSREGLERIAQEAAIEQKVQQLDFLDRTQRKMLRSGAFLAKSLPKDWSRAKRWAVAVTGEEREALELLLGEREQKAKEIAQLVKATYHRKAQLVLQDSPPWYKIVVDEDSTYVRSNK